MIGRIELLRANASRASHAELDAAEELDAGGLAYVHVVLDHDDLRG